MAPIIEPNIHAERNIGDLSCHRQIAALSVRDNIVENQKGIDALKVKGDGKVDDNHMAPIRNSLYDGNDTDKDKTFKVGIIGAGSAGLFVAMIFDYLKGKYGLKVDYEILEAHGEDRLGGRLYTYRFPELLGEDYNSSHDYYDVGAMRFPEIEIMKRTFKLFEELEMHKTDESEVPKRGQLRKYYLDGENTPSLYNDVQVVKGTKKFFSARDFGLTEKDLPKEVLDLNPSDMVTDTIKCLTDAYDPKDPKKFWDKLMNEEDEDGRKGPPPDAYSVRQWLVKEKNYGQNTIEFLETMNFGNRWYDQALSEMVCETLDFDDKATWWCVEGGSQIIAGKMAKKLKQQGKIRFRKTVTEIKYTGKLESPEGVEIKIEGQKEPRHYDTVFNSATLGAMQHMKLEGLNLNWGVKQGIRSLGYGASCKVGIRFKNHWWRQGQFNIHKGGVAKTDLPLRCCVYPSYNFKDDADRPGVLLVSYTWSQEAQRLGALINRNSPEGESRLKDVLLHDLAKLHARSKDQANYEQVLKILEDSYVDHHAYDWYADPVSVGAFAYFGPGQFSSLYKWITRGGGKHIVIGEAASAHHAWVVGALESAVRGVYQFLYQHSKNSEAVHKCVEAYSNNEIPQPFGPLPAEFDRTTDIEGCTALKDRLKGIEDPAKTTPQTTYSPRGEYLRHGVLLEMLRLAQGGDQLDTEPLADKFFKPILQAIVATQA